MLSITGLAPPVPGINYPDIAARFARYEGWLNEANCLPIRYEDLVSDEQPALIRRMAEFYAGRSSTPIDVEACARSMAAQIAPHKSHTFRSGKKSGWELELTAAHRERFAEIAGELLIRLGYEPDLEWAREPVASQI
jgi:hypothetical protein